MRSNFELNEASPLNRITSQQSAITNAECVTEAGRLLWLHDPINSTDLTFDSNLVELDFTSVEIQRKARLFENRIDQASDSSASYRVGRKPKYPVPKRPRLVEAPETRDAYHPAEWLSAKAAARYLSTTVGAIRNRVHRGQLTCYHLGRSLRFKKSELDRLLEASRKGGFYGS